MTKTLEYQQAIQLRLQGKSFNQIKTEVIVSKSTLSRWLKSFPLTINQIDLIKINNHKKVEKFRQTMKVKKDKLAEKSYLEEKAILTPVSFRELYIAGLFLYWGEGNKASNYSLSINNTDPSILKFTLIWMIESLHIPKSKIRVFVHLYNDMKIQNELIFWSNELCLPLSNFEKPYIKKSSRTDVNHKGFNHGTCGLKVHDVKLKRKVIMGIKAISDVLNRKVRGI